MGWKTKTLKKTAKWAAPFSSEVDTQVRKAMKMPEIRDAYENYHGEPENFRALLKEYLETENQKNKGMRRFAAGIDTVNKTTVPLDAVLEYFTIMGGVGTAARGIKTLALSPGYLAYDAYYLGKTHDILGALGNLAYEVASWISLGSLPHLMNKYTKQADKFTIKEASKRFLRGLEERTSIIQMPKRGIDLEGLAAAA